MGRRRKTNLHLPERVYFSRGWHFYRDEANKWIRLGREWDRDTKEAYVVASSNKAAQGTVADMLDRFITHRELMVRAGKLAPATLDGNMLEVVPLKLFFGAMHYADVKRPHIAKYLKKRSFVPKPIIDPSDPTKKIALPARLAPVRANREIALLSSAYSWAMGEDDFDIRENPCYGVRRNKETPKDRCPERWEIEAVKKKASPMWSLIFDLGYKIGQRGADTRTIPLLGIQEDGLFVKQSKTGQTLLIEWDDELIDIVLRMQAWSDHLLSRLKNPPPVRPAFLILTRRGQPYTKRGWITEVHRWVMAALDDPESGLKESFSFHDIRAKSATDEHQAGGRPQHRLGHKKQSQTDDYIREKQVHRVRPMPLKAVK